MRGPESLHGYEILSEVGGGQGRVARARQPGTGRMVALKRLSTGAFSTATQRRRFEREIEILAALNHPGVVAVHGVEELGGVPILIMEWVEGVPLHQWADDVARDRAGIERRLDLFLRVCEAVQYVHGCGVVHRDLKPSNVLVDRQGRPRVLDFGVARRMLGRAEPDDPTVTRSADFFGTPAYAAPETFAGGARGVDVRGDVFSLGVVLYELLAGQRPFAAERLHDLLMDIEARDPVPVSRLVANGDSDLDAILFTALAKDPARRYQTVHALAEDIQRWRRREPVLAKPPTTLYLVSKWIARHRLAASLTLALAMLLVWMGILGTRQAAAIREQRDAAMVQRNRAEEASRQARAALADAEVKHAEAVRSSEESVRARDQRVETLRRSRAVQDLYVNALLRAVTSGDEPASMDVEVVLEQVATSVDAELGPHPAAAVEIYGSLARTYLFMNRHDTALGLLERGLALLPSVAAPTDELAGLLFLARGETYISVGRYRDAEVDLRAAAGAYRRAPASVEARRSLTTCLSALGTLYTYTGQLAESEACLRESAEIGEEVRTKHAQWMTLNTLGGVISDRGRHHEALDLLLPLIEQAESLWGPNDILVCRLARSIASAYAGVPDHESALPYWRKSLDARRGTFVAGHPQLISAVHELAGCLMALGRVEDALTLYREAAAHPVRGHQSSAAAEAAVCLDRLDRVDDAAAQFEAAWAMLEVEYAAGEPARVLHLTSWLEFLTRKGSADAARERLTATVAEVLAYARQGRVVSDSYRVRLTRCGEELGQESCLDDLWAKVAASAPPE